MCRSVLKLSISRRVALTSNLGEQTRSRNACASAQPRFGSAQCPRDQRHHLLDGGVFARLASWAPWPIAEKRNRRRRPIALKNAQELFQDSLTAWRKVFVIQSGGGAFAIHRTRDGRADTRPHARIGDNTQTNKQHRQHRQTDRHTDRQMRDKSKNRRLTHRRTTNREIHRQRHTLI